MTHTRRTALVAGLVTAAVLGATGVSQAGALVTSAPKRLDAAEQAGDKTAAARPEGGRAAAFDRVAKVAREKGRVRVTITLADAPTEAPTATVRERLARQAAAGRSAVLGALVGEPSSPGHPGAPAMSVLVTPGEVAALRREGAVRSIAETVRFEPAGTSSFGGYAGVQLPKWWHQKRIGLGWTQTNGYTGAGQKVVVVDTGVDDTHPWLAGRVVDGACFSQTGCGNGYTSAYGIAAGRNCTFSYTCAHGTHVAHIAAGKYGVASSAQIVAINAVSRSGTDVSFNDADLINALWYSYNYVSPAPAAVNMSIGSASFSGTCDSRQQTLAGWVSALRARGTATVFSAGNKNSSTGINYPACLSKAVAIGNATLTSATGVPAVLGGVSNGSNSNSLIDLWAPGTDICSAVPTRLDNDGTADGVACGYVGTSMAAPQVAGAFAVMRAARPSYTVDQTLSAFVRNGLAITDTRNGVRRSMLNVANAVYYG